jgi:hypothetical protein
MNSIRNATVLRYSMANPRVLIKTPATTAIVFLRVASPGPIFGFVVEVEDEPDCIVEVLVLATVWEAAVVELLILGRDVARVGFGVVATAL